MSHFFGQIEKKVEKKLSAELTLTRSRLHSADLSCHAFDFRKFSIKLGAGDLQVPADIDDGFPVGKHVDHFAECRILDGFNHCLGFFHIDV